jgi:aminoglycoside phosphotransferase (APT) family kinase protein
MKRLKTSSRGLDNDFEKIDQGPQSYLFRNDRRPFYFNDAVKIEYQYQLLAPHTSGPRDVPRCGALSLLQKLLVTFG